MKKYNCAIRLLLWVGLVRIHTGYGLVSESKKKKGTVVWPIRFAPRWIWKAYLRHPINMTKAGGGMFYVFRNRAGVIKWLPGRLLPRRWGCGFFGLIEFGDRG